MSKQTAVDFIVDKIFKHSKIPFNKKNCPTLFKFIEKAKEMEEQQTIDFAKDWWGDDSDMSAKQYYNETFNK